MNSKNLNIKGIFLLLFSAMLLLTACEPDEELTGPDRLFRPTLKGEMVSRGNWLEVNWQRTKDATSYKIELSRDTFKTIDASAVVDTNYFRFDNLEWDQLYQVQVQAFAADPAKNSRVANLGGFKTAKFPTILAMPTANDVTDAAALVRWTNSGATATSLQVFKADDRTNMIKEVPLTAEDVKNQFKRVTGLAGNTRYVIYAYSGETLRGWEYYTTKAPQVFAAGSIIVDLRGETDPAILNQTLQAGVQPGTVIILDRGMTYTMSSSYAISGSLSIVTGLGFGPVANINMTTNFNFADGSQIDSVLFRDLVMKSDNYGGRYIFNTTNSANVGTMKFQNVQAEIYRGIVRLQRGVTTVNQFTVTNCIMDSVSNYGILTIDHADCKVNNITLRNSTIYKAEKVITSRATNSNSILIENCTFNETPMGNNYFIDYNSASVTSGIRIVNTIFGEGKYNAALTSRSFRGIRAVDTTVDAVNTYTLADYVLMEANPSPINGVIPYSKKSTEVWVAPRNGNFRFKDNAFPGRTTAGDPRWRL